MNSRYFIGSLLILRYNYRNKHVEYKERSDEDIRNEQDSNVRGVPADRGFILLRGSIYSCEHEVWPHLQSRHFKHHLHTLEDVIVVPTRGHPGKP
jgi:hypothetical protein